jgi:hypothetical protein
VVSRVGDVGIESVRGCGLGGWGIGVWGLEFRAKGLGLTV